MSKKLLDLAFIALAALSPQVLAAYDQTGCFSSPGNLTLATTSVYMSLGMCKQQCLGKKTSVAASQGTDCYCGESLPPSDTRISSKECDMACPGYPRDFCGGSKSWTFMADQILTADDDDPNETTSLTIDPTLSKSVDPATTIPANILTAPSASFTKNAGVADTSSAASSATAAAESAAASSSSASASAASPSPSSGATGTLVRSVGAGSVVGAALIPLAMSWF